MKKILIAILMIAVFAVPVVGLANGYLELPGVKRGEDAPGVIIGTPGEIEGLAGWLLTFVWGLLILVVVGFFLYAGFLFVTAAGSDEKITQAKQMVTYGIVGVIVMLLAWGVVELMQAFLEAPDNGGGNVVMENTEHVKNYLTARFF